jgi:methylglutaconyl-CoA hydratase
MDPGMGPLTRSTDARGVATLTLNRPEKHNAFDTGTLIALGEALRDLEGDSAVRVVVLTGAGRTFCSGADLASMRALATATEDENLREAGRLTEVLAQLASLSRPTVARVNGNAFGGGVGLVACCDIAVADENAKFTLSEVRLGLVPAAISPYVVAAIGTRQARRYFQTGEAISATEARRIGLVHETAVTAALDSGVASIVEELLKGGPQAQREAKELIREVAGTLGAPDAKARRTVAQRLARLRSSEEGRDGMSAFLEKRSPRWRKD